MMQNKIRLGAGKSGVVALGLVYTLGCAEPALCGTRTIEVTEQLGVGYGRELVSVPFSAEVGECVAESVALTGPAGRVPVQLSDVVTHADRRRTVKSATVWFVVDKLDPLASADYTLSWGEKKVRAPKSDLQVKERRGIAEIATGAVAVCGCSSASRGWRRFDESPAPDARDADRGWRVE